MTLSTVIDLTINPVNPPDPITHAHRTAMIEHYVGLAKWVAMAFHRNSPTHDLDDAIGYAFEGLIDAVNRYDPSRGVLFTTYATVRIRGAVSDGFRREAFLPVRARLHLVMEGKNPTGVQMEPCLMSHDVLGRVLSSRADETPDPADQTATTDLATRVNQALNHLNPQQRSVLRLYYWHHLNFAQIGRMLGFTESRGCQIHRAALNQLARVRDLQVQVG